MLAAVVIGVIILACCNAYVVHNGKKKIISVEQAEQLEDVDCILVLGCYVKPDQTPSHMLEDRLKTGVSLYQKMNATKLLMSGDHGTTGYNEVGVMKQYAINQKIPSKDIFMDHAGFSTYDSIYRAKKVFQAKKIVIVTQSYHLYRALYIADCLGIKAYGVASDLRPYAGQEGRDAREVLARIKDVGTTLLKIKPKYLGEVISLKDSGDVTND